MSMGILIWSLVVSNLFNIAVLAIHNRQIKQIEEKLSIQNELNDLLIKVITGLKP